VTRRGPPAVVEAGAPPANLDDLPARVKAKLRPALRDVGTFSDLTLPDYRLRGYQVEPARAIVESVVARLGRQLAVVFSRQAGKDELLAQVIAYLLVRQSRQGGNVVVAAPTFRPQAALCRDRLLERLGRVIPPELIVAAGKGGTRDGYVVRVGRATARFLSAAPEANARGQTADLLLVANEAQDIRPAVWDAVFDPMAASTNATTLFLGTVWSRETLLARQMRFLTEQERADGSKRVWKVAWEEVAHELPAYGERVRARMAQLGSDHPFVRTEYCLEELEGDGGLFPPHRLAQMQGDHPRRHRAERGRCYALLLDVAGEEEGGTGPLAFAADSRRDSTALTVVEIDQGERGEGEKGEGTTALPLSVSPPLRLPVYRVVDRRVWTGMRHSALHGQLVDLVREVWRASAVVVDATGIGAGLASFLAAELGTRRRGRPAVPVIPFVFSAASKSALGWEFLGLIDAGRFKEYADDGDPVTALYWAQLRATAYEAPPGPNRPLRWGVPAGRGPGHDDLVLSAALVVALEGMDWRSRVAVGTVDED
jgi:hypothetical protein